MKTLEKQQKKGHYTITIGYDNQVQQHIMGSFDKSADIPASMQRHFQKEYSPSSSALKAIVGIMGIRFIDNLYRANKSFISDKIVKAKDKYTDLKTGETPIGNIISKVMPLLTRVQNGVTNLTNLQENQLENYSNIMYTFLYMKQFLSLENTICGPAIPFYFLRRLDKYGFQKVNHAFAGKKETRDQMKWMFLANFMEWLQKNNKAVYKNILDSLMAVINSKTVLKTTTGVMTFANIPMSLSAILGTFVTQSISLTETGRVLKNTIVKNETNSQNGKNGPPHDKFRVMNNKVIYNKPNEAIAQFDTQSMLPEVQDATMRYFGNTGKNIVVDFLSNPLMALDNLFEGYTDFFERWYASATRSITLYTTLTAGYVLFQHVVCKRFADNKFILEIDRPKFNGFLKKVILITNKNFEIKDEYESNIKNKPVSLINVKLSNKVYEDNNNVADQIQFHIKELLRNLPENVFVYKVEYYGEEEDNAIVNINDAENSESSNNNDQNDRSKLHGPYDVVQTLYNLDGPISYEKNEITFNDKEILRYVNQYNSIYLYKNRKTFARKYLFNTVTDFVFKKPVKLSPSAPIFYSFHFLNTVDESFKLYFYDVNKPWMKHVRTIRNPSSDKNSFSGYVFVVNLMFKKFVERNFTNIMADIPKELKIIKIERPKPGNFKDCSNLQLFPVDKKNPCYINKESMTYFDKMILDVMTRKK